jgi:membrane-bound lytic murein transglycosylase B
MMFAIAAVALPFHAATPSTSRQIGSAVSLAALTPPQPAPPGPPNAPHFLTGPEPVLTSTGDPRVDVFRERIFAEAGSGWRPYLLRLFQGVTANPGIVAANQRMDVPKTPAEWVRRYVTPRQIAAGRRVYRLLRRKPPPSPAGTPLEVQVALWGMYANYGSYRPRHDPIQTYLMLGAYGQGPTWTYFDFYKVAELIVTGQIRRATAKTHEDGRLGQVQLLPDEWQLMARDGNKDGRVDIWSNQADIFASIGPIEWEAGTPMVVEVRRPRLDPSNPAEARMLRGIESGSVGVHMFPRPGGGRWPAESRGWGGRYVSHLALPALRTS